MATKKRNDRSSPQLNLYAKLVETIPALELKGATMPYTSQNGHMFSFLDKEGKLGLRLPKQEREAFITLYSTDLCEAHGKVLKEYVLVPEDLLHRTKELKKYFEISYSYVSNLKPKNAK